jgi:uncharacterized membrane-anchored protein YhcB (DUF1043 family)
MWVLYGELLVLLGIAFMVGCLVGALAARLLTRGSTS